MARRLPSLVEFVQSPFHFRRIFGVGRDFQVFRVGLGGSLLVVLLLLGFAQTQKSFGECSVPLGRLGETMRGCAIVSLLEIVVPDLELLGGLKGIERVLLGSEGLVLFRRRLLLLWRLLRLLLFRSLLGARDNGAYQR